MSYAAYPPYGQPPPQSQQQWGPPPPIPPHPPHPPQQGHGYGYNQGPPTPQSPYHASPQSQSPYPPHSQPPYQAQSLYPPYPQQPPPPQGYGAPHGPPPTELYGSPATGAAHGYYNQHEQYAPPPCGPPPAHHGAPPTPITPSHSPMSPYGAPPYGGTPQYGASPMMGMVAYPTPPSPGYGPIQNIPWDPTPSANALRKAMKGLGTKEGWLIDELADKDPFQIEAIKEAFKRIHRRELVKNIKSETSGWFGYGIVQLASGPLMADVQMLYDAMKGAGTKEKVLNDVLLGRSNADINAIKREYKKAFDKDLVAAVKNDLSLKTERHFEIVLSAQRVEDSIQPAQIDIDRDVDALYSATEGKLGTDEMRVCSILSTRNNEQIKAIAHAYRLRYARDLDTVIKKEFRGHMEDALLFQLNRALDKHKHQAELIEESMKGAGTKDYLLVSRVVRSHWDKDNMERVKGAYLRRYGKPLGQRIKGETGGDYRTLMLACIGEPWLK